MRILVQKFGGTSLATTEATERVIHHIRRERDNGYAVVIVVSAIGRRGEPYATDTLLELLDSHLGGVDAREKDLLISCGEIISATLLGAQIRAAGIEAIVYTGAEAGIETDEEFGSAKITSIKPEKLIQALKLNKVVVVTGFQGRTRNSDVTTLGRGGSDTTATALGAALHAEFVDIYTDVNGVLTADPRFVADAKPIAKLSYAEICHMAREGAKVVHPRAVEIAQQARIPVRVRSTFSDDEGTLVQDAAWDHNEHAVLDRHVTGIAHVTGITQLTVQSDYADHRAPQLLFQTLARHGISVDFINVTLSGAVFTVQTVQAELAKQLLEAEKLSVKLEPSCAKISIIGGGMNGQPGVMANIITALSDIDVPILQSADSNAAIWVLVKEQHMVIALMALHSTFDLNR
ncbi:aspartate kinase [Paenibacillus endoradicis]|uniref:aspartate kinase n=1 Tax=Paenibacillus endoradicis TaxID=2972487 RepID=UPI00215998C9|nr:aspartate kinase [Paenibacillus endoradicis]MCR8656311.1 aspartate kinase [Paenibacillus endoradicis]